MPWDLAWDQFRANWGSVYDVPSVAFMNANCTPSLSTFAQSTVPCQCETSMPSA
jgi:hypothetical protein